MRATSWNDLVRDDGAWAFLFADSSQAITPSPTEISGAKASVHVVRGERCLTEADLMAEWARALNFPDYFGHNWDAFDECIADLEWLSSDAVIVLIMNCERVLQHEDKGFRIWLSTLDRAARELLRPEQYSPGVVNAPKVFRVVFQCRPEVAADTRSRITAAGTTLSELEVETYT